MTVRRNHAFTMIELLTVVAITAILMTIIVVPIFQSFNFTRAAQSFAEAQNRARAVAERIARETGNAVSVRDNSGLRGAITLALPGRNQGTTVLVTEPGLKLDLVIAAQGEPETDPNTGLPIYRDPNTGKIDPTLRAPKGQVVLPVAPGQTLRRWWVGLRDPFQPYNNPYDGLLMARNGLQDNLFVLYVAEVQPLVLNRSTGLFEVNQEFFETTPNGGPLYDDPQFFNATAADGTIVTAGARAERIRAWKRRAQIVTDLSRYDMIQPFFDRTTRVVTFDNRADAVDNVLRDRPRVMPLIRFQPGRVSSDPAEGQIANRLGEETDNAAQVAPDVYRTAYGGWSNAVVRTWPQGFNASSSTSNAYIVGRSVAGVTGGSSAFRIFAFDPDTDGNSDVNGGQPLFDADLYASALESGQRYPFSLAVASGVAGNADLRSRFLAYYPDTRRGQILASFHLSEVGTNPAAPELNLPTVATGNPETPVTDTSTGWAGATSINQRFNRIWNEFPSLRNADGTGAQRFIDLRVTPQADGTPSPLDPRTGFARARIVPGSEEVWGPDQNPGPNYGSTVRYTRTTRSPGPNQYRINYVDQNEPNYAAIGFANPPSTYTATDFVSAVIQPRFRAGYLQLFSSPNVALPAGEIRVGYRFQFTLPDDVFAVDYDSRQLMEVQLTIRNFPQSNLPNPQTVTLRASATVRNFIR